MAPDRRRMAGAVVLFLGVSFGFFASPPAAGQNLLTNSDFNHGQQDASWSLLDGQGLDWLAADRNLCPASGYLHLYVSPILRPELGAYTGYAWSDCIVLPAGVTVLQMNFDWTDNTSTTAGVVRFPDAGCADVPSPSLEVAIGNAGIWNHFESEYDVTGRQSVRVEIGFDGADLPSLIFDRVYVGILPVRFLDDFEGGATCRWSSHAP